MKTLKPEGIIRSFKGLVYLAILFLTLGLFLVYVWHYDKALLAACMLCSAIFLVAGVISTPSLYFNYWIKYGGNKIIVCRYTAMSFNGKYERRVDEFPLDEIEKYGHSMVIFKRNLECHRGSGVTAIEFSFKLKDGREIGFDEMYFTKEQMEELTDYICRKTGIMAVKVKNKFYRG